MLTAITRDVNENMGDCELTFLPRVRIDAGLTLQQHQQYQSALSSLGCEIVTVPTEVGPGGFRFYRGHRDGSG